MQEKPNPPWVVCLFVFKSLSSCSPFSWHLLFYKIFINSYALFTVLSCQRTLVVAKDPHWARDCPKPERNIYSGSRGLEPLQKTRNKKRIRCLRGGKWHNVTSLASLEASGLSTPDLSITKLWWKRHCSTRFSCYIFNTKYLYSITLVDFIFYIVTNMLLKWHTYL